MEVHWHGLLLEEAALLRLQFAGGTGKAFPIFQVHCQDFNHVTVPVLVVAASARAATGSPATVRPSR
jgi:hypothetical protein